MFEQQTLTPISLSGIASNYVLGSDVNSSGSPSYESGVLSISLAGLLSGTVDVNAPGASGLSARNLLSGTLSLALNGRVTIGTNVYYLVSPNRFIEVETTAGVTAPRILDADH
jgi:hypothetical protein